MKSYRLLRLGIHLSAFSPKTLDMKGSHGYMLQHEWEHTFDFFLWQGNLQATCHACVYLSLWCIYEGFEGVSLKLQTP